MRFLLVLYRFLHSQRRRRPSPSLLPGLLAVALAACGGSSSSETDSGYRIGGQVSGLTATGLALALNDGTPIAIAADGPFTFPERVDGPYRVAVTQQPAGQVCSVSAGSGDSGGSDVSDVRVVCAAQTFAVGGSVQGLAAGARLRLLNNGGDPLVVRADGRFRFAQPVAYGGGYAITVGTQPTGQTCSVRQASADGVTADVTQPVVVCADRALTVGGRVDGLADGQHLTLQNNGDDATVLRANGRFRFATQIAWQGSYEVTVATQPEGQICSVTRGSGHGAIADVDDVGVACADRHYTIGGSVSGLQAGAQLTLRNNGADPLTVSADGAFSFALPVAWGGGYAVTVSTQPVGQTCTVSHGAGTEVTADVSTVAVTCSATTYRVGGSVSGLLAGASVTLLNQGADPLTVSADGSFEFATPVAHGGSIAVTVGTQPADASCVVTNGSQGPVTAAVSDVQVDCTAFPVSFLYIPDYGEGKVIGLTLNRSNGDLVRSRGAPYAAGASARWVVLTPDKRHLYVANGSDDTIGRYDVDRATGALTPVDGGTVVTGSSPVQIEVTPDGKFAYVLTENDQRVSGYAVDPTTGALTALGASPVTTGITPTQFALTPDGDRLYVANRYGQSVSAFSVDAATGALTEIAGSPFATSGGETMSVSVHPNGAFLYAVNRYGVLDAYAIDAGTGTLAMIQAGGYAGPGSEWRVFGIDGTGTHGYLGTGSGLYPYAVDPSTGVPTLTGAPLLPNVYTWIGYNADRSRLYIADAITMSIDIHDVNSGTGALTPVGQGTYYGMDERPLNIGIIERTPSGCGGVAISSARPGAMGCKRRR